MNKKKDCDRKEKSGAVPRERRRILSERAFRLKAARRSLPLCIRESARRIPPIETEDRSRTRVTALSVDLY